MLFSSTRLLWLMRGPLMLLQIQCEGWNGAWNALRNADGEHPPV